MAALILLAVLLRIGWFTVRADGPVTDPDAYVRLARMLADGRGFVAADGLSPTAFRPVLYPLVLSVPLAVGLPVRTAVLLCSLISVVLLVVSVAALARAAGLNRRSAAAAGFVAAVDPLLLKYSLEPMTENLSAALTTAAMCGVVRYAGILIADDACRNGEIAPARMVRSGAAAGVLLGLSALCRPIGLITCVLLTGVLLIMCLRSSGRRKERRSISLIRGLAPVLLPATVAAATIMPWVVRNAVRLHAFVPATTHGGYTLLLGNNSVFYDRVVSGRHRVWDGKSLQEWQGRLQERMKTEGVLHGGEPAVDRWMYGEALREMRNRPDMAWRAGILRWQRFWAVLPTNRDNLPGVLTAAVAVWYGIGLAGVALSLRRVRTAPAIWVLWAAVASFLIVHTFYWTNTRMRAPLTGVLAVLAVAGWCRRPRSEKKNGLTE